MMNSEVKSDRQAHFFNKVKLDQTHVHNKNWSNQTMSVLDATVANTVIAPCNFSVGRSWDRYSVQKVYR